MQAVLHFCRLACILAQTNHVFSIHVNGFSHDMHGCHVFEKQYDYGHFLSFFEFAHSLVVQISKGGGIFGNILSLKGEKQQ